MSRFRFWVGLVVILALAGATVYFVILRRGGTMSDLAGAGSGSGSASSADSSQPSASSFASFDLKSAIAGLSDEQKQQMYDDEVAGMRERLNRLQAYVDGFPAALTSVDALADTLTTPQAAFEFVRDQIVLEPYPGILKGPRATLLTRGGNSLERARLLAAILAHNRTPVKIAHGRLSEDQARGLLVKAATGPSATESMLLSLSVKPNAGQPTSRQQELANAVMGQAALAASALRQTIDQVQPGVDPSMRSAGLPRAAAASARQLQIAADHYWVQATVDGQEVDFDPAAAAPRERLTEPVDTFGANTAAAGLHHRVRFRVVAESLNNGRLQSADVLSAEFTAADLFGKNIRVAVAPASPYDDERVCHAILMVGNQRINGRPFQLSPGGSESSGAAGGNPNLGTGAVTGGTFGAMGGGEGGTPAKPDALVLGRLYLEVVSRGPALSDARYRRMIMDRLEPDGTGFRVQPALADDATVRPLLMQAWDGAISVGPNNAVFVLQTILEVLKAHESMQEKARARLYLGRNFGTDDLPKPALSQELIGFYFASDVTRYLLQQQRAQTARSYYERPRVAFLRHGFVVADWSRPEAENRFAEGVDLLNAPFQFLGGTADTERLAREAGVADTVIETRTTGGSAGYSAVPLFAAAALQNVPTVTVTPDQADALQRLAIPAQIRNALRQDLAEGQSLVVPTRLVKLNGVDTYGWWSIDGETGYALGKMELGGGQGFVEVSKINERVQKWSEIFAKFYSGVMKCYLGALGDSLASVDVNKQKVTLKRGAPGESPMPTMDKLAECVIAQACDAIAELLVEASITPAFAREAEGAIKPLQQIIAEWIMQQEVDRLKKDVQGAAAKACEERMKR